MTRGDKTATVRCVFLSAYKNCILNEKKYLYTSEDLQLFTSHSSFSTNVDSKLYFFLHTNTSTDEFPNVRHLISAL